MSFGLTLIVLALIAAGSFVAFLYFGRQGR